MDRTKLIYIADDDYSIREALKAFLDSDGYEVCDFDNGDALLAAFNKKAADLVILDVVMPPGSSGFVVCRELRKISKVPVIMLTARDSELDQQTAMDLGCDYFYTKPTSPMKILERIKEIFERVHKG
ncbi:MAG: response regulator [Defluviitaleaceae bacterium]|nr:response regulator [Defluviitaleaceae bacterium]